MSLSDADRLEQLKLAYDTVLAGMVAKSLVVSYRIAEIQVTREPSQNQLDILQKQIAYWEKRANAADAGRSGYSFASFRNEPQG
jgi:hypothetical protein